MDHHGPWKLKHILSSKIWWCLALAWDSRITGVFFCLPNNSKNNSFIETWIRADVNFPLPMCDKKFLPFPSSPSFPPFPHSRPHQWFWTELRKLGKRFHNLAQASFPAAWVVEVSCFKTLLGHSVFFFCFTTVDVQTMNLRWQKEELDMLDLSCQFHGRSFLKLKESQFPFHDFQIHFPVYLNSGALWTLNYTFPIYYWKYPNRTFNHKFIHKYEYMLFSCARHNHIFYKICVFTTSFTTAATQQKPCCLSSNKLL